jgi:hypothetical protein
MTIVHSRTTMDRKKIAQKNVLCQIDYLVNCSKGQLSYVLLSLGNRLKTTISGQLSYVQLLYWQLSFGQLSPNRNDHPFHIPPHIYESIYHPITLFTKTRTSDATELVERRCKQQQT